jgi:energy-coupling factor transport system ATP-binding protein
LSCLIGLNRPTAGRILINGQDIRKRGVAEQAQVVGYLFQNPDYQLFTDTVYDEVAFGLKNRQSRPDDIEKRVCPCRSQVQPLLIAARKRSVV